MEEQAVIYYSIIPESITTADFEKIYSDISPLLPDFRRKKAEGIIPARERAVSALSFVLPVSYTHLTQPTTPYV